MPRPQGRPAWSAAPVCPVHGACLPRATALACLAPNLGPGALTPRERGRTFKLPAGSYDLRHMLHRPPRRRMSMPLNRRIAVVLAGAALLAAPLAASAPA